MNHEENLNKRKIYIHKITYFQCSPSVLRGFFSSCLVSMRNTQMWQGKLQRHYRSENIIQVRKVSLPFLRV